MSLSAVFVFIGQQRIDAIRRGYVQFYANADSLEGIGG